MGDMGYDLEQFAARLSNLESEMKRKPALRCIFDADLDHNLSALRLMGILPPESAALVDLPAESVARKHRHGGTRRGAGRKPIHASRTARKRAYRRRVREGTKSSSQVANFIDVKQG